MHTQFELHLLLPLYLSFFLSITQNVRQSTHLRKRLNKKLESKDGREMKLSLEWVGYGNNKPEMRILPCNLNPAG